MLNKAFLQKMKENLVAQKQDIVVRSTHQDIDIDVDGDETDEIQGNILIEINNQLHIRNNARLNQIDDALKRIEDKSYGICEDCSEKIPEKRLTFNPYFLTCVACAEDREIEDRQRKRS